MKKDKNLCFAQKTEVKSLERKLRMAISAADRKRVKSQGFLSNRDGEHFSVRIITENGVLSASQLKNLSEVAERFGNGNISFTSRMTLELPGISFENIEAVKEYVAKDGMVTGGTGAKVRPVVSCKGSVCTFGLLDTQAIATQIHKRFFEGYGNVTLPHKFKIAVGGCPNNCVKPDLNDFGITGQNRPVLNTEACRGCKKCLVESSCPMQAAHFEEGTCQINRELCNNCGICQRKCPFGAIETHTSGCRIYIGGRWGKQIRHGSMLKGIFSVEEALDILEKSILLFKEKGQPHERFGSMIDRIGLDKVEQELLEGDLLQRKQQILEKA